MRLLTKEELECLRLECLQGKVFKRIPALVTIDICVFTDGTHYYTARSCTSKESNYRIALTENSGLQIRKISSRSNYIRYTIYELTLVEVTTMRVQSI